MDDRMYDALEALAAKMGTTAEHLWGVLVRQAAVSAIADLAVVVGIVVLAAVGWRASGRIEADEIESRLIVRTFCILVPALALVFAAGSIATRLINPEYFALEKVLLALRGL